MKHLNNTKLLRILCKEGWGILRDYKNGGVKETSTVLLILFLSKKLSGIIYFRLNDPSVLNDFIGETYAKN